VSLDILRVTFGIGALAWGLPLAACGDFSADPIAQGGSGATSPTAGSSGSGGSSVAGSGGSSGGTGGSGPRPEPPKPTCTDVAACGGDVAGVWFASGSCLPISGMADISDFGLGCKEVAAMGKLEVTGNWTLTADGSISDNTTTTGTVKLEVQPACLNISGTVTKCDRLPAQLEGLGLKESVCTDSVMTTGGSGGAAGGGGAGGGGGGGGSSAGGSSAGAGGAAVGCTCDAKINQMGSMAHVVFDPLKMGKYTTASNKLTTTGLDSVEYDYCVQADIMTVTPKVPKDIGVLNGTVVFQKQE
jgi:hypothetical protein